LNQTQFLLAFFFQKICQACNVQTVSSAPTSTSDHSIILQFLQPRPRVAIANQAPSLYRSSCSELVTWCAISHAASTSLDLCSSACRFRRPQIDSPTKAVTMTKLTALSPEIRNTVYDLLVMHDEPIPIASPRKKHILKKQKHSNFASLLRVDKQFNQEAKTLFYARNTFVMGNGHWCSTVQANVQALKEFIRRVPGLHCIHSSHRARYRPCD
jgi:hypothetical protein